MAKKRVHEIAKAQGLTTKELLGEAACRRHRGQGRLLDGRGGRSRSARSLQRRRRARPRRRAAPAARRASRPRPRRRARGGRASPTLPRTARAPDADAVAETSPGEAARAAEAARSAPDARLAHRRAATRGRRPRRAPPRRDRLAGLAPPGGRPGQQPVRRPPRRGRRRRGTYDDTVAPIDEAARGATDLIRINSGSTVKDVAEYFGVAVPEIIRKLMSLGEMATLTQTLSDDAIGVLASEFDKEIEIVHAADDVDAEPDLRGRRRGARAAPAGRHDHGPRRPRQDLAAGRDPRDRGRGRRGRRHHPAHRRLPGPPRRHGDHLPRHPGPRGLHRDARPRRPRHRHRGDRRRRRRRRQAADRRGDRPRPRRRRADHRRRQQDRQGGRRPHARAHRDDPARPAAGGVGRRGRVRRRLGAHEGGPRRRCSRRSRSSPSSRSCARTRTPRPRAR